MDKIKTYVLTVIFCSIFLHAGFGATIVLKNGKKVEGRIIEQTNKYVKLDFQGAGLIYFADEVASVEQDFVGDSQGASGQVASLYKAYTSSLNVQSKPASAGLAKLAEPILPEEKGTQSAGPDNANGSKGVDVSKLPPEYQELIKKAMVQQQESNANLLERK